MRTTSTLVLIGLTAGIAAPGLRARAPQGFVSLTSAEIRTALVGKHVGYAPPNSAVTGITEDFRPGGAWGGTLYGRGPVGLSGRWSIGTN